MLNLQVTSIEKPQLKVSNFHLTKHEYLIRLRSDIVVNLTSVYKSLKLSASCRTLTYLTVPLTRSGGLARQILFFVSYIFCLICWALYVKLPMD